MRQRHKHFLLAQMFLGNEFTDNGIATAVAMFVSQTLEDPLGGVPLLLQNLTVILKNLASNVTQMTLQGWPCSAAQT
jgi:hypothetical protein